MLARAWPLPGIRELPNNQVLAQAMRNNRRQYLGNQCPNMVRYSQRNPDLVGSALDSVLAFEVQRKPQMEHEGNQKIIARDMSECRDRASVNGACYKTRIEAGALLVATSAVSLGLGQSALSQFRLALPEGELFHTLIDDPHT